MVVASTMNSRFSNSQSGLVPAVLVPNVSCNVVVNDAS